MILNMQEADTPRFLLRISEKKENFVRRNPKLRNPIFFAANTEERLPKNHPLRTIQRRPDEELEQVEHTFDDGYSETGRPGIPPEALLNGLLLQALCSIRCERRLVDAISWNLFYRWLCNVEPDAEIWDATAFTYIRNRFERHGMVQEFSECVVATALVEPDDLDDQFTVDGTLIQSWAWLKSFRPKHKPVDRPPSEGGCDPSVNFRREKHGVETPRLTTDSEARLARKSSGTPTLLSYRGHVLKENRHGLCLKIAVAVADDGERDTARRMLRRFRRRHGVKPKTLSADHGHEPGEFLRTLEDDLDITPHAPTTAQHVTSSVLTAGTRHRMRRTKTQGYALSQRARKKIGQMFGWLKQAGGLRKVRRAGR